MRDCDGFIPSLLHAVNSSLQSLNEIDNKSIENCMCILRNLSYKLQEVIDRDYDRNYPAMAAASTWSMVPTTNTHESDKTKMGCMGSKQKKTKAIYDQASTNSSNVYAIMAPHEGRHVEMLWQTDVIGTYVHLLRHSSNPDTLEATAGCIQNLSTYQVRMMCTKR
jgi:catenin delta-2